jgi:hypothetical protein
VREFVGRNRAVFRSSAKGASYDDPTSLAGRV